MPFLTWYTDRTTTHIARCLQQAKSAVFSEAGKPSVRPPERGRAGAGPRLQHRQRSAGAADGLHRGVGNEVGRDPRNLST